jgi:hypothetical protein
MILGALTLFIPMLCHRNPGTIPRRSGFNSMNMRFWFSAICCILTVAASSGALAQETNESAQPDKEVLSTQKQRQQPLSDVFAETTWLPGGTIRSTGSDITMGEVKAGFSRRFVIDPKLDLSAGMSFSFRKIDAPDTANLPEALYRLSLDLGGAYHVNERLTLGLKVSPGVGSDLKSLDADDIRVPVAVHAGFQATKTLSLLGGIAYTGLNHSYPVMLVLGARYVPSEHWAFALGFPRTGVMYRPNRDIDLFAGAEFSIGEYQLHDPSLGANVISYRDYRALVGADFRFCSFAKLGIAGGYAFARKFVFYEGNRNDINLDGAPLGRVSLTFDW